MSGPKVVRIVTREEILAVCHRLLARLDEALAAWERAGQRHGMIDEDDVGAHRARREALARLIEQDRFMEFQKEAPREIEYLHGDREARIEAAMERAAAERRTARQRAEAATALLRALAKAGKPVEAELAQALRAAAEGRHDPRAMAAGLELLGGDRPDAATANQALAGRYAEGLERQQFADWSGEQAASDDPQVAVLDRRVAELAQHHGVPVEAEEARLRALLEERELPRRRLLADSLSLDLAERLGGLRKRARVLADLAAVRHELLAIGADDVLPPQARLDAMLADELGALLTEAAAALEQRRAQRTAEARRQALLHGLAALGYEVTEGMETVLADSGGVVLRNATRPGYGVEIGGLDRPQAQLRAVRFVGAGEPDDPAADRDAETLWCQDVEELQAGLAGSGHGLEILRALPVGATALKRVSLPASATEQSQAAERPVTRPTQRSRKL